MSRIRMVAVAGLVVVLAGCGTVAGTGSTASTTVIGPSAHGPLPTPSSSAAPAATPVGNVLRVADSGATVTLAVGQRLTVDLAPGSGASAWDQLRLTGSALQLVSATGGYPSHDAIYAVFLATAPGTAVLSSASDLSCPHAHPRCLVAQRVWRATVIVRPSDGGG